MVAAKDIATKQDIMVLKNEMLAFKAVMVKWILGVTTAIAGFMAVGFGIIISLLAGGPCAARHSGNVKSLKFHNQFCGHFHCRDCVRSFNSRDEALAAGFAPCKRCGG